MAPLYHDYLLGLGLDLSMLEPLVGCNPVPRRINKASTKAHFFFWGGSGVARDFIHRIIFHYSMSIIMTEQATSIGTVEISHNHPLLASIKHQH